MSTGTVGYGSTLSWSTTIGGSYTPVAQTRDLSSPEATIGKINLTNNDSPNNTKEYKPGMIDPGESDFKVVYKKDQYAVLYAKFGDGIIYYWKEVFPDGSNIIWPGYLSKCKVTGETEDKELIGEMAIQAAGAIVHAQS